MSSGQDTPSAGNFTTVGDGNGTFSANTTIWGTIPDNPGRSLQPDIIACGVLTWLIALTLVVLRFYTRSRLIQVLGPTDWCIGLAVLFAGGMMGSTIEQAVRGSGLHPWQMDLQQIPYLSRAAWYGILFYWLSLTFTKISILLLYRRIFTYSWVSRAIQIVLAMVVVIGAWLVATVCTACVPLEAFWNWSLVFTTRVYCHPINVWWANAGMHIATDFIIFLLPMPMLSTLRLPRRQKLALVGVFALGFFVCLVSILRLLKLIEVETAPPTTDSCYTAAELMFWTSIEVNTAISCACVMTLKPLVVRFFPRLLVAGSYPPDRTLQRASLTSQRESPSSRTGQPVSMSELRNPRRELLTRVEDDDLASTDGCLKQGDAETQCDSQSSTLNGEDENFSRGTVGTPPRTHTLPSI